MTFKKAGSPIAEIIDRTKIMTIDSIRVNPDAHFPVLVARIALPFLGMTLAGRF